jgi:signal transduction histidine kinase
VTVALTLAAIGGAVFEVFDRVAVWLTADRAAVVGSFAMMWTLLPAGVVWLAWRRLREARRAVAERDRFMESVAHRLRTPLSSVVGYSLLMRDEPDQARPEDLWWMVEEVATRSVEAADLLDDMLVAAHLEHGGVELLPAPIDLSDETEWVLRNYLGGESVDVIYTGFRRWALADPVRVRQILRILLGNARSHGGDALRIEVDTSGPGVRVTVADNGFGLPHGREDEVFDAFVCGAAHDDARFPIGLGLTVASELAGRMGGSLQYRRDHAWTCFDFTLPLADPASITYEAPRYIGVTDPVPPPITWEAAEQPA